MENFFWTVGVIFEPQFSNCRRMLAKVNSLLTTIDDVYDVYGTLDELELFTDAIVRWDLNFMDQLPHYMKLCFLSSYNSVNEMAYDILKDQGVDILPYLKKAAKWYYSGYTPSLQEYLDNAWVSISAPVFLVHAYFYVSSPTTEEALHFMEEYPDIIRWSSMILRLADDLGTSSDELKRGDVSKSIQCYMYETEVFEEKARDHIKNLIGNTWKKINDYRFANTRTSQTFIGVAMNLARMAQCMYQYGDGHGVGDLETKDRGEPYTARNRKLKAEIRMRLANASKPLDQLELIDTLQRLGLSYHFVDEIESILKSLFDENHIQNTKTANDLFSINSRTNKEEGESILDDARDFTTKNLEKYVKKSSSSEYLSKLVSHALKLPLAWRMLRLEANWFINVYETKTDMEPKLDFNMVQAIHQEDLKHSARWWKSTGLGEKLDFARDRPMENFFWTVGVIFEPQFSNCRRMLAKVNSLITTIDDVYDVYGTLDELELFTDAIVRWDLNFMDQLPHYMKLCFLSLYNSVNEMAYDILKDQGVDILPYLKKADELKRGDVSKSIQCYMYETKLPIRNSTKSTTIIFS
uniref:Terpene synthase metal-binding domain-containing protein n=1 Tax=Salix viminalis TaxID=40686 RepID=A0A6N2KWS5_SALVM